MTVSIGFLCKDAIVMAADSLYEGAIRTEGRKIFLHNTTQPEEAAFALAGAGYADDISEARADLLERLRAGYAKAKPWPARIRAVLARKSGALNAIVDASEFPDLLIALKSPSPNNLQILKVARSKNNGRIVVNPITESFVAIGSGEVLASYIASKLFHPEMSLHDTCALAAFVVAEAKKHSPGCGGPTNIIVIPRVGRSYDYDDDYLKAGEKYFDTIFSFAGALARTAIGFRSHQEIDAVVDLLKPKLVDAWQTVHERLLPDVEQLPSRSGSDSTADE